jgi:hypothetical protein
MAQSLDSFVDELRADVGRFEAAYRAQVAKKPEHYPLELPDGQEGLWLEFFLGFVTQGSV